MEIQADVWVLPLFSYASSKCLMYSYGTFSSTYLFYNSFLILQKLHDGGNKYDIHSYTKVSVDVFAEAV